MLKDLIIKFKWWQLGIYEIGLFALGFGLGGYWADFAGSITIPLLVIAIACLSYIGLIAYKQCKEHLKKVD